MKNKILFITIFLALSAAGISSLIYVVQKYGTSQDRPTGEYSVSSPETPQETEGKVQEPQKGTEGFIGFYEENFSLVLPYGWVQISPTTTWPIIIADSLKRITDKKVEEIGFGTNLSINWDELNQISPEDYIKNVKESLIQSIPIIEIVKEEKGSIRGKEANFVEIDSVQQDISFKTLLVFVTQGDTIWAISFNTLKESWPDYQYVFRQIAESFKLKETAS